MKKVIFLIFIIWGCSQNILAPKYSFTATFLDAFTNEPIEGIELAGVDASYPAGIGVLGGGTTKLKSGYFPSSKNGDSKVSFHRYKRAEYYVVFMAGRNAKYFTPSSEDIKATVFDSKKDIKMVYKLDAKAKVRLKVNFINKLDDGDSIELYLLGGRYGGGGGRVFNNKTQNTQETIDVEANITKTVAVTYNIKGVRTTKGFPVTFKPFVVNEFEFTY